MSQDPTSEAILTVENGSIRGTLSGGVRTFYGVPYAAAPVGHRRFAVPAPPEPWQEVREATEPGATAPQPKREFPALDIAPLIGVGWEPGDEYLNANIWAPEHGERLPVMVFIHGGAFLVGGNSPAAQDGTAFARSGVVLVSITYRMGVDGFAPMPGVPDNLGLRDQIEALRWVQRNIAVFGGDPRNVTIFGESAGAMSVANLVASPLATGLFRRAIVESGHGDMVRPASVAERVTAKMAKMLRVKPTPEGFASVPLEKLVAALAKISLPTTRINHRDEDGRDSCFGMCRFAPWIGGEVLPQHPRVLLANGAGADVDLLIGCNSEEMNLYFVPTGVRDKLPGWLAKISLKKSDPNAAKILKAYGLGKRGVKPGQALTHAMTDLAFRHGSRKFAAAHRGRTHVYEFGWKSPAVKGQLGAAHAVELPFVFNTLACVTGPLNLCGESPPQELADKMHGVWVEFARTGTLSWPEYSAANPVVHHLDDGQTLPDVPMPCAPYCP